VLLNDAGLTSAREPPLRQVYVSNPQSIGLVIERARALLFQTAEPEFEVHLPVTLLTRVGRQLSQTLTPTDEEEVLLNLADGLRGQVRELYLVTVNSYVGGKLSYSVIRQL
jgi:hypothetical protein